MAVKRGTSQRSFDHNVSTEYRALRRKRVPKGKAVKQAVAIAYSVKRRAAAKKGAARRRKG